MNLLSIFFLIFNLSGETTHEIHVSKCLIKYDEGSSSIQVSLHIFLDDLEAALEKQGATNLFLCTDKESIEAEAHLTKYLKERFSIKQNGKLLDTFYIGKEISEDLAAVWCYLEINDVEAIGSLEITNDILMDLYDDQKNVTSVKLPGTSNYFLFQKDDFTDTIEF